MDDSYRGLWQIWARSNYPDPSVASAAVNAALAAIENGSPPAVAAVQGHQAAIAAEGEYRCRPDRTGKAILVCFLFAALFIPAGLSGLSVNASFWGYVFLAVTGGGPLFGMVGMVLVRVNSYFFVTRRTVGRRSWLGRVVETIPRAKVIGVDIRKGSWKNVYSARSLSSGEYMPDDSTMQVKIRGGFTGLHTILYWWTDDRLNELSRVLDAPSVEK